jgi:hypothetical protein
VADVVPVETGMGRETVRMFRGLPPFLRLTTLVGVLCLLTYMVLAVWELATWVLSNFAPDGGIHLPDSVWVLFVLGMAFLFTTIAYRIHEQRSPDTTGIPLRFWWRFWKKQVIIWTLELAPLICGIVLVLVGATDIGLVVILVGLVVNFVDYLVDYVRGAFRRIHPPA